MSKNLSVFNYAQTKVLFGSSALATLPKELEKLHVQRLFIVTDEVLKNLGVLDPLIKVLGENSVSFFVYDKVEPDPVSKTVDDAVTRLMSEKCDAVIGIGGGSVMDCAKCIAAMASNSGKLLEYDHALAEYKDFVEPSLPLISIPTTSGTGSEVSPYAVITNEEEHRKATIGSSSLISKIAVLDPIFVKNLPKKVVASTGMDALTHCIEAYTSINSLEEPNPVIDSLALQGIRLISQNLYHSYQKEDENARANMMWGSLIGGIVLPYGSGAAHGLGNVLGGEYHVPHGVAVGMLLPHVIQYNYDACKKRYMDIASVVTDTTCDDNDNVEQFIEYLQNLLQNMQFPVLSDYVTNSVDIKRLSALAVKDKCTRINAKPITEKDACDIYTHAMKR